MHNVLAAAAALVVSLDTSSRSLARTPPAAVRILYASAVRYILMLRTQARQDVRAETHKDILRHADCGSTKSLGLGILSVQTVAHKAKKSLGVLSSGHPRERAVVGRAKICHCDVGRHRPLFLDLPTPPLGDQTSGNEVC